MAKKLTKEQRYERSGKRPGTPVGTRLSDAEYKLAVARVAQLKLKSLAAWLLTLARADLGVNASADSKAKRPPTRSRQAPPARGARRTGK